MAKKGLLISNLGSPDEPTRESVKKYLDQFLMDPYVIDVPYILRALLIRGIVLRTRPQKSAEAYKTVWTPEGAPLVVFTRALTQKVQQLLGDEFSVKFAMRYGNPSFTNVFKEFANEGIDQVDVMPLYPQWALASTASTLAHIRDIGCESRVRSVLKAFYDQPAYTDLYAERFRRLNGEQKATEKNLKTKYVFSFHGLPERHIRKSPKSEGCQLGECCRTRRSDYCYRNHSVRTADAIAQKLNIAREDYIITFQSRLGPDKWLQPPTDEVIKNLPAQGIERCIVFSPAFVADCLETLEELADRARHDFLSAGGKEFYLVPSLNGEADWSQVIATWAQDNTRFDSFAKVFGK